MESQFMQSHGVNALRRLAFGTYLRSGRMQADGDMMAEAASRLMQNVKFNPNHDPRNGRFTFAPNGGRTSYGRNVPPRRATPADAGSPVAKYYEGMTVSGLAKITPTGGGYFDVAGNYVPEMFGPDPYRLTNPASALAHYIGGSGTARNYYLNSVDTSNVTTVAFPAIRKLLKTGTPGLHVVVDASTKDYNSGLPFRIRKLSAAGTAGRLKLRANGVLAIENDGRYIFSGMLSSEFEYYDFNRAFGRTPVGEFSTTVGRHIRGTEFVVHIIGTKPFSESGHIDRAGTR